MYDIYDLWFVLPFLLLLMYWWGTSGQKSVAVAAARAYCTERKLQLLDQTLAFHRFGFERGSQKQRRLCRIYQFDYCLTGADRHKGEIVLSGYAVLRVILHGGTVEITEYDH
ncbi:MAG: DUF3301 domain-containing protein [Gammaproteobacteria bacterium]|nr:DUF3301 domain-containing protein [Gammaproteobacteria bacterium]